MIGSQIVNKTDRQEARPDASQIAPGGRFDVRSLSREEKQVYDKWRRGTFVLYGVVAMVLGSLILGSVHTTNVASGQKTAPQMALAKRGG